MDAPRYPRVLGYDLVSEIGGGGFSTVFRAVNISEHRVAACKLVTGPNSGMSPTERKAVEREMTIHRVLKHSNVLEFLDAVVVEWKYRKEYVPGMYMLLEFAGGGDLFDKIAPYIGVDEGLARYYFLQLLSGMRYVHSEGVCHRDLKPENLLLDAAGTLKIADFGLSTVFRLKATGKTRTLTERCGTLPYVAPELNGNSSYNAEPIDVWGVGVILFALLVGDTPWDEPSDKSLEFYYFSRGLIFSQDPWTRIGELPLDILKGLLEISPERRLTLEEASRHPWVMSLDEQISESTPGDIADRLVRAIKTAGDLELASPSFHQSFEQMENNGANLESGSQFTQSLLLFSQTPSGTRYTPQLTRFYSSLEPIKMAEVIQSSLESFKIKCKHCKTLTNERGEDVQKLRIGGLDGRNQILKGWVDVESFHWKGVEGSFCIMKRDEGNPISWRQLWKRLVCAQLVNPYVLKK